MQGILYVLVFLIEIAVFAKVRARNVRQAALLAGSYVLYFTWGAWFSAVLLASTAMNYLLGEWLRRKPSWPALGVGILLNLGLLFGFKYLPELAGNMPFASLQPISHLALPLGISFWTFQALSYLFDVYRGERLDSTFFEFGLYMVFFPVTISGPVCRMTDMLRQFRSEEPVAWSSMERGFGRIATGVLMMQLAKLLGHGILAGDGINSGFDRLTHWSGADVWCLAFGYGLQLFFDFAGYSHIVIGIARLFGQTSFLSTGWGLLRLAVPTALALVALILIDAYADPAKRSPVKPMIHAAAAVGFAFLSQATFQAADPELAVPLRIMLYGGGTGLVLLSALHAFFAPGDHRPRGAT